MSGSWARLGFVIAIGCGGTASSVEPDRPTLETPEAPAKEEPTKLVSAALIADVTSVAPGQELNLAIRLDIEPSWHIYWLNPGEAGLPTEVTFGAPDGFAIGPVRYQGPMRFEDPGSVVTYGYEQLALLSSNVVAPDALTPGSQVTFSAKIAWLACREACIRGSATSELRLPVAGPDSPSAPAHESMFRAHVASLPRPLTERANATTVWDGATLVIDVPGAESAEYFPSAAEQQVITGQAVVPSDGKVTVRVSYRPAKGIAPPTRSTGVLRVVETDTRYYSIDIPWPQDKRP